MFSLGWMTYVITSLQLSYWHGAVSITLTGFLPGIYDETKYQLNCLFFIEAAGVF